MQNDSPTAKISMTLDKRTVERIRLVKKVTGKDLEVNERVNKAILSVLDSLEAPLKLNKESWKTAKICPNCAKGVLFHKSRRTDQRPFFGCSNYPNCKHSENA